MVDKIDKPEAPPPYAITSTTETKRDKPQDQKGQEDLPTFQQESPSLYKEKFQESGGVLKTIRVPLADIQKLLYRRATPRHGTPTAEADLIWKDGRKTEGISFLLQNWQDFLKIKNLKVGEVIPETLWQHGITHLEVTTWQATGSGPWNLREIEKQRKPITQTVKIRNWQQSLSRNRWTIAFCFLGVTAFVAIILMIWKGL